MAITCPDASWIPIYLFGSLSYALFKYNHHIDNMISIATTTTTIAKWSRRRRKHKNNSNLTVVIIVLLINFSFAAFENKSKRREEKKNAKTFCIKRFQNFICRSACISEWENLLLKAIHPSKQPTVLKRLQYITATATTTAIVTKSK